MRTRLGFTATLLTLAALSSALLAADPTVEPPVREDFTGFLSLVSGPAAGRVRPPW